MKVFTDGELRQRSFMSDFNDAVDGFDQDDGIARTWQASGSSPAQAPDVHGVITSRIKQRRRLTAHEVPFLKQHSPGAIKITLPTPNQFPAISYKRGVTDKVYSSHSDLLWDMVPIFKAEIRALLDEGIHYVQIDAPRYSYYIDPKWQGYVRTEMGLDPRRALDEAVRIDNACLEGARRPSVVVAMHLCRGNNRSQWYAEGGYGPVAEKLFAALNVDRFLLEYDDERSGSFEPLRFIPKDKTVVLGLVSSKRPQLESPTELARSIERAAHYVPLENLALSPQCGFASTMKGNLLTEEEQWAKLKLVVDTAHLVWR